jgi:hypothetical protein
VACGLSSHAVRLDGAQGDLSDWSVLLICARRSVAYIVSNESEYSLPCRRFSRCSMPPERTTMTKSIASLMCVFALAAIFATGQASANITYSFSGVTFNDGGTLTGTFITNDTRTSLINYDILTSPNVNIGFHYTPGTSSFASSSLPFILVANTPPANDHILQVTFSGLSAAGGGITIGAFDSFEQGLSGARRNIVSGSVIAAAVPEPETYAMLLAGLGLLGYIVRRKRA